MNHFSRIRYWLPLFPLLGLLGVTYWLNQQVQPDSARANDGVRHDPDAVMENFTSVGLSVQGSQRFIMAAKKLQHYPDDDSTLLDTPNITLLSDGQQATFISANQGIVSRKGDEVFLHHSVKVLREAGAMKGKTTVHTEYLHIVPNRDWADTDSDVAIVDEHNTIHARGLEIDNKARTMKLLTQVRGEHVSSKN